MTLRNCINLFSLTIPTSRSEPLSGKEKKLVVTVPDSSDRQSLNGIQVAWRNFRGMFLNNKGMKMLQTMQQK